MNKQEIEQRLRTLPVSSWPWPRVLVGILMERTVSHASKVFHPFMDIAGQGVTFAKQDYTRTDLARNRFAMALLQSEFTHLLMLDLDHIHPKDIVQRLSRWVLMNPAIEIVGGLNFRRSEPYEPCCFVRDPNGKLAAPAKWSAGLMPVDYLGTGSILIKRTVFEKIEPPWFFNIYSEDLKWTDTWPGEDIGFNEKCAEHGIKSYVDTTTTSPHVTDRLVTQRTFESYLQTHPDKYRAVDEKGQFVKSPSAPEVDLVRRKAD